MLPSEALVTNIADDRVMNIRVDLRAKHRVTNIDIFVKGGRAPYN